MHVYTDQPSVHVYVGGKLDAGSIGKQQVNYHTTSGICFETQHFPDSPNHDSFPTTLLRKGETYHQTTIFKFEI
jgi:aldose 1-epimerase